MTEAHIGRWWQELSEMLAHMPKEVEIFVGSSGQLNLARRGAVMAAFEKDGHAMCVPEMGLPEIRSRNIHNIC